jgi:hypothetical protein
MSRHEPETEPRISDDVIIKGIFDAHIKDDSTVQEVFDTLSEKQKNVVYFMIGQALEESSHDRCIRF